MCAQFIRKAEDRARVAAYRVSMNAVLLPTGVCQGVFKLANSHHWHYSDRCEDYELR